MSQGRMNNIEAKSGDRNIATFVDIPCPNCIKTHGDDGLMCADKFGLFCAISECGWKREWTAEELEAGEYQGTPENP